MHNHDYNLFDFHSFVENVSHENGKCEKMNAKNIVLIIEL